MPKHISVASQEYTSLSSSAAGSENISASLYGILNSDITQSPFAFYIKSPNNTVWQVTMNDSGVLSNVLRTSYTSSGDDPVTRYWRLSFTKTVDNNSMLISGSGLQLREADTGGSNINLLTGVTMVAYTTSSTWTTPFTCYVDPVAIRTVSMPFYATRRNSTHEWISFDFGAGNNKTIRQVQWTPSPGWPTYSPSQIRVQYSLDGISYIDWWAAFGITGWTTDATKIFRKSEQTSAPDPTSPRRYWKIKAPSPPNNFNGGRLACSELELMSSYGVADATAPVTGAISASSVYREGLESTYFASRSIDNNASTYWLGDYALLEAGLYYNEFSLKYDFMTGSYVRSMTWRQMDTGADFTYLHDYELLASDSDSGVSTWWVVASSGNMSWTAGERKTLPGQPTSV